jgi:hypothetical protein
VQLQYYRLQKIREGSIDLTAGQAKPLDGPQEVGSGLVREETVPLSRLIDVINARFGTDFTDADQLFFDQIVEAAVRVVSLPLAARANPVDKFLLVFLQVLELLFIERMDTNEDLFARFMNEPEFQQIVAEGLGHKVYGRLPNATEPTYPRSPQSARRLSRVSYCIPSVGNAGMWPVTYPQWLTRLKPRTLATQTAPPSDRAGSPPALVGGRIRGRVARFRRLATRSGRARSPGGVDARPTPATSAATRCAIA